MKSAAQVDSQHGVPSLSGKVLNARDVLNTGVVHQHIHLAKLRSGKAHHVFNVGGFAHVSAVISHLAAECQDLVFGGVYLAKAVEHDIGTLLCQSDGDAQSNSTGGASDERCFTLKHFCFSG